ncbi:MAG: CRISPR-associated helicase/endonuclease Cas3 [Pseudomonadota bacterium]
MNNKEQKLPIYYDYWGKTAEDGGYHLLPYHCLDVAAVGASWWQRDPVIRRLFVNATGQNEATCLAWLLFFLALHDLGKIDIRFQLKASDVLSKIRPNFDLESVEPDTKYYHGPSGWEWFVRDSGVLGIKEGELPRWGEWMRAVCGHHGSLSLGEPFSCPEAEDEVVAFDAMARTELLHDLADLFLTPEGLSMTAPPPPAPDMLAGFCSVSDWIGSNQQHFEPVAKELTLATYLSLAQQRAAAALDESGVFEVSLQHGGMEVLYPDPDYRPRQVQTVIDELPIEPGLTLIEAPTGSGKTEAALAYASRLLAAGLADSVIFALPTQATANAMFTRLNKVAHRLFPAGSNLLLAHGRAKYNTAFSALKASLRPTAQGREEAAVQCVEWLSASRKRVFLGQLGVCTIDQVFLSVLPVRHQFVRAFGVRKSVLIIDEVHAYDAYMYGLLENVLSGQRLAGGTAILLSATLPAWQKRILLGEDEDEPQVQQEPYPMITHVSHRGTRQSLVPDEANQPHLHTVAVDCWNSIDLLPTTEQRKEIIAAASQGALVGIVCNLVADAQQLAAQLRTEVEGQSEAIVVDLFHARYRFKDRQSKEEAVMEYYGKEAKRQQGRILVATQVIEQSLDLDFDWLISQLCPVDLLFQRIGRLHRHPRDNRPAAFTEARCTVLAPSDGDYLLHKVIYGHRQVLWRTQQLLQSHNLITFPSAYRDWIERVYAEQPWEVEPESITKEAEQFRQSAEGKFYGAKVLSVIRGQPLPDTEGAAGRLTRDGEMSLTVVPIMAGRGKVLLDGQSLDEMDEGEQDEAIDMNAIGVPAGWRKWLPPEDDNGRHWVQMAEANKCCDEYVTHDQSFTYSPDTGLQLNNNKEEG